MLVPNQTVARALSLRNVFMTGAVAAAAVLATATSPAHAADRFWDGTGGDQLWSNTGNWAFGDIAGPGDVAVFDDAVASASTADVDLNGNRTVGAIIIQSPFGYRLFDNTLSLESGNLSVNTDAVGFATHTIDSNFELMANGTLTVASGYTLVVNGDISESGGTRSLTKGSGGVVVLEGENSYTGLTDIRGGTLRMGVTGDSVPDASAVSIASGATLAMAGNLEQMGILSGGGDVTLGSGGNLIFGSDNGSADFSGSISGSGTVQKGGTGVQTLSGVNTYSGPTFINFGTLRIGPLVALPNTSPVTIASGGTLDLNGTGERIGSLSGSGSVTLGSNGVLGFGQANGPADFSGSITGSGVVQKRGSGVQTLSGDNSYTGHTDISSGTLRMGVTGDSVPDTSSLSIASGAILDMATTGRPTSRDPSPAAEPCKKAGPGSRRSPGITPTPGKRLSTSGRCASGDPACRIPCPIPAR